MIDNNEQKHENSDGKCDKYENLRKSIENSKLTLHTKNNNCINQIYHGHKIYDDFYYDGKSDTCLVKDFRGNPSILLSSFSNSSNFKFLKNLQSSSNTCGANFSAQNDSGGNFSANRNEIIPNQCNFSAQNTFNSAQNTANINLHMPSNMSKYNINAINTQNSYPYSYNSISSHSSNYSSAYTSPTFEQNNLYNNRDAFSLKNKSYSSSSKTSYNSSNIQSKAGSKCIAIGFRSDIKEFINHFIQKEDRLSETYYEVEIEIDHELEDFLCGKKNGKINKISKDNNCEVKIEYKQGKTKQISIYIYGKSENIYNTISQLEWEFPAELCFHLHEKHHKRIIGYGGKNIQKIMKKHGVYIKFMCEEERSSSGYAGNVIIKTPKRNSESLFRMKDEVLQLAEEEVTEVIIPHWNLDLFYAYELGLNYVKLLYEYAVIEETNEKLVRTYKLPIVSLDKAESTEKFIAQNDKKNAKVVRLANNSTIFLITLQDYLYEAIDAKYWLENNKPLAFNIFDSKLFYTPKKILNNKLNDYEKHKIMLQENTGIDEYYDESIVGQGRDSKDEKQRGK
ncbi:hypothetical protein EDEG_01878 [Edhazardia aedis USNM 41457]|uniref:K Homology domain-containing protein n=1 Tax=Edhazardia aedis (strain USNM 41457) TaxID=1003232 RepID=J9D8I4_EDHAE|nr:hypothetical protein EDEG_01878 [Edhazardia aedis USNM 41457]|eukprot:EJW03834.1 hypothetical protein EDEG_01878 [Edhazardia aedis USNM 41457]